MIGGETHSPTEPRIADVSEATETCRPSVKPHIKPLRTFVRSSIVLKRVYACELQWKGETYKHIAFTRLSDTEPSVEKGYFIKLYKNKPAIPPVLLKENEEPTHNIPDTCLTEEMVNAIFSAFDNIMELAEETPYAVFHFSSDGLSELTYRQAQAAETEKQYLRRCYSEEKDFIADITDFESGETSGFFVTFNDGSLAGCVIRPIQNISVRHQETKPTDTINHLPHLPGGVLFDRKDNVIPLGPTPILCGVMSIIDDANNEHSADQ